MKKAIIIIVVIVSLVVGWFVIPEPTIKNVPLKNNTIAAFGDSLIAGVGATDGNDLPSLLGADLNQQIINLGVSGNTSAQGLGRIDEVISLDPGLVIVLLGGNDYLRKVPIEQTRGNLANIISVIQNNGSAVLLLGVRGGILSDNYKDMYKELAKEYQTAYVSDVLSGVITNRSLMSDSIHPNDAGYRQIADRILPVLNKIIN